MPRKGHSEEQIIMALRQAEAGKKVADVCREMGVSQLETEVCRTGAERFAGASAAARGESETEDPGGRSDAHPRKFLRIVFSLRPQSWTISDTE